MHWKGCLSSRARWQERASRQYPEWYRQTPLSFNVSITLGNCIAPGNKSRWFYHAHKPEEREDGEHGHFHMFLPLAMFDGVEPYYQPPARLPNDKKTQGVVHFGALSFDLDGMPMSWFTTNYWVTHEYMMPAEAIAS